MKSSVYCHSIFYLLFIFFPSLISAEIEPETIFTETLPAIWPEHWFIVNHLSGARYGRTTLIDGDTASVKGTMSHGYWHEHLVIPRKTANELYAVETYYSRASRGERTDVVTIYDKENMAPQHEIVIPAKHYLAAGIPNISALTDNDQFLVVFNFTPAMSLSIVDVKKRKFVKEEPSGGCALVYPSGPRQFFSLCANGSLLHIKLGKNGSVDSRKQTKPFFNPDEDPLTEKAVRYGAKWLFISVNGNVQPIDFSNGDPVFEQKWTLVDENERNNNWKIGGFQHAALHQKKGLLYSLMHQGGADTYKDPGIEIWVYDIETKKRIKRIELERPFLSIQVTQDNRPLLFGSVIYDKYLDIYDAVSGVKLRSMEGIEADPTLLQIP
ncbi:MAG: amine dehydrogenase large subunit [Gammaproteobacteria bacterium]|nr:amine dehydrogenase large subunit [Gammaproteobacteria bacterium]